MFRDRADAGRRLAGRLMTYKDTHPVVLALPRGGVPVGLEIALALDAPLDVILVRKIGAPSFEELAIGALAEGEPAVTVLENDTIAQLAVPRDYLDREIKRQGDEIQRRQRLYRKDRSLVELHGSTAIVVDDGIATGATMRAALRAVRQHAPARLVMAVPVAPRESLESLRAEVDEIVCLATPDPFDAISLFYAEFAQLRDDEVTALLSRAPQARRRS